MNSAGNLRKQVPGIFNQEMDMNNKTLGQRIAIDFKRHKWKYLIALPIIVFFILFAYKPMYGVIIAFKQFRPSAGITGSPWVGFKNFQRFFNDIYFARLLKNTLSISLLSLVFSFPAPIVLALLLNEVKVSWFKRGVQTITYMPHFISVVIVCSLLQNFF
jgi:putative aldouronate transport system permease protein